MRLAKQTRKIARSATVRGAIVFNAFSPDSRPALTKGGRAWGASSILLKKVHICARSIGVEFGNRMRPLILYMLQSPPGFLQRPVCNKDAPVRRECPTPTLVSVDTFVY